MAYLRQEDKDRSRELWAEAFPEDTEAFQEYYYQEKTRDNRILCREENGRVISMIHLNPYRVMVKNQIWRSDYIVGVATAKRKTPPGDYEGIVSGYARGGSIGKEPDEIIFF